MTGSDVTVSLEAPLVLDLLPVGVAVIDVYGTLRFANARMLAMTGFSREDVVGRSVLDFVPSEEFSNAADILSAGRGFIGRTMGPMRLRYRGADGQLRTTEMWAQNCLDVAGIDGYVATFAEESVNDHMSRAFDSISSGAPLEATLRTVIDSMAVHPMEATAVVALQGPDGLSLVGDWPLAGYDFTIDDPLAPWTFTLKRGQSHDFPDLFGLPADLRAAATDAGFRSVWVRPIVSRRGLRGALIVWRRLAGLTSPNQEQRMADAVSLAAVAFDHAELRPADVTDLAPLIERRAAESNGDTSRSVLEENGAILAVNVEGLERVGAECGRDAAEAVLDLVGARLAATVRAVDEVIDRGPNTFAAVCSPPVDRVAVIGIANRIVRVLSSPYFVDRPDHDQLARRIDHLTVNVGIAFQTVSSDLDDVVERAEDAMRIAASEGPNEWRIADSSRRQRVSL
ncbi:MAG: PAS domain-containing protein [Ilumatobacteraceae bacterium]